MVKKGTCEFSRPRDRSHCLHCRAWPFCHLKLHEYKSALSLAAFPPLPSPNSLFSPLLTRSLSRAAPSPGAAYSADAGSPLLLLLLLLLLHFQAPDPSSLEFELLPRRSQWALPFSGD